MPNQLKKAARVRKAAAKEASSSGATERLATPAEYNAFIETVGLKLIRLAHCELDARTRYANDVLEPRVEEESSTFRLVNGGFLVFHSLKFSGVPVEGSGAPVTIRATFELEYSSSTSINQELFAIFRRHNLPVNIWPFFRELVHTILARANWPVFVLPALRIPAAGAPRRHRVSRPAERQ